MLLIARLLLLIIIFLSLLQGFLTAKSFLCDGQSLCFSSVSEDYFKPVCDSALTLDGSIALALAPDQAVVWTLEPDVWKQLNK